MKVVFGAIVAYLAIVKVGNIAKAIRAIATATRWTGAQTALDIALDANIFGAFLIGIGLMAVQIPLAVKEWHGLVNIQKNTHFLEKIGDALKTAGKAVFRSSP